MSKNVLEFRPNQLTDINNPLNNLVNALTEFVDAIAEKRVAEILEGKQLAETKAKEPLRLLKAKEVAAVIGCAETTVNGLADSGKIPMATTWTEGTKTFRRFNLDAVLTALATK